MNSNQIEQVPPSLPVALPNNPNPQFTPGGSDLALWLFFLGVWKATPPVIRESARLLHEVTLFLKMWMSKSQPPHKK